MHKFKFYLTVAMLLTAIGCATASLIVYNFVNVLPIIINGIMLGYVVKNRLSLLKPKSMSEIDLIKSLPRHINELGDTPVAPTIQTRPTEVPSASNGVFIVPDLTKK